MIIILFSSIKNAFVRHFMNLMDPSVLRFVETDIYLFFLVMMVISLMEMAVRVLVILRKIIFANKLQAFLPVNAYLKVRLY